MKRGGILDGVVVELWFCLDAYEFLPLRYLCWSDTPFAKPLIRSGENRRLRGMGWCKVSKVEYTYGYDYHINLSNP